MNIEEIKERVKAIEDGASDDECAHVEEDKLRADFITYIADNYQGDLSIMAKEVLRTEDINFSRWYA